MLGKKVKLAINQLIYVSRAGQSIGIVRKGYLLPKKTETFHAVGREVISSLFLASAGSDFR